jgi:hypothetical protein
MAITTRATTSTGVTNNGSALTNAQLDANFIDLLANSVKQAATRFTCGGSANVMTGTLAPAIASYIAGMRFTTTPPGANSTTGPSLNLNAIGAVTVKKRALSGGTKIALAENDYNASGPFDFEYDGTDFILINPVSEPYLALRTQTCWVPAGAMTARTTNGAAAGTVELATNKIMLKTLDFDTTTAEYAQFGINMPKSWDLGTVYATFIWSHAATTTNFGVAWSIAGVAISNDDALDVAFGTAIIVIDTGGTTDDCYATTMSEAVTIGGTPALNDYVIFQVKREVADGGDNMAIDARLIGVRLHYKTNVLTDA